MAWPLSLSLSLYIYICMYVCIQIYGYIQSMGSQSRTQLSACKHTHKKLGLARDLGNDGKGVLTDTVRQARGSS